MGVVNVTPDSFSDGGRWLDHEAAVAHGLELHRQGAAILDIGGESTRPGGESTRPGGAEPVDEAEELRRVEPVVRALREQAPEAVISIDTMKAGVAEAAIGAGATYVNDVTALRGDPRMAAVVADAGCELCLMHMLGTPRTMQEDPRYDDVVGEVAAFLSERAQFAQEAGIDPARIQLDPGIGFGKTVEHNLELLRNLGEIVEIGFPVVVGLSRKRFLGAITGREEPSDRVAASVAGALLACERGASVVRVHDVAETVDALKVAAATLGAR